MIRKINSCESKHELTSRAGHQIHRWSWKASVRKLRLAGESSKIRISTEVHMRVRCMWESSICAHNCICIYYIMWWFLFDDLFEIPSRHWLRNHTWTESFHSAKLTRTGDYNEQPDEGHDILSLKQPSQGFETYKSTSPRLDRHFIQSSAAKNNNRMSNPTAMAPQITWPCEPISLLLLNLMQPQLIKTISGL